jgi:NADH-quinone oxidoreductase subunit H
MVDWIELQWKALGPTWQGVILAVVRAVLLVVPVLLMVVPIIWFERRLLGWFQDRIGPNRTGNITFSRTSRYVPSFLRGKKIQMRGLAQPMADGLKLFMKEDITPHAVDKVIYFIAPAIALFPAFTLAATIPWGPFPLLTPVADVNIGVLYIMAISSLGVYGIVLAGYAGNNKFSLLGGLRSSAQLISYELAMAVSLACIVMTTGSLKPSDMVAFQDTAFWGFKDVPFIDFFANWNALTPFGAVAALVFLICMVAETNRAPFDLPEAENELVAGYHTEYSSMKFAVFFMGEYASMFVYGMIFVTVFFGGYRLLPIRFDWLAQQYPNSGDIWHLLDILNGDSILGVLWFILKAWMVICFYIWLRATMPRLRYDQLMSLGWKSLLPLATANLVVVALWIVTTEVYGSIAGWIFSLAAVGIAILLYRSLNTNAKSGQLQNRKVTMVDPAPRRTIELVDPVQAANS